MPRILPLALLAILAMACGGSDSTGPVPVSRVDLNRNTIQFAVGDSVLLTATLRDASGNALTGRSVQWQTTNGGVATVSSAGWVKAIGAGTATITATSETITAEAQVSVTGTPVITAVAPALLTPGAAGTITGTGFASTAAGNVVRVAGVAATVTAATATQLSFTVPAQAALPCRATHNAAVTVTVGGITGSLNHPLQVATQQSLGVDESITFPSAAEARCNEFSQTGGRYLVTVQRPDNALNTTSAFRVTGEAAAVTSPKVISAVELPVLERSIGSSAGILAPFQMLVANKQGEVARRHRAMLDENLRTAASGLGALRRAGSGPGSASFQRSGPSFAVGTVGDTTEIKIPNRNLTTNLCTSAPIKVRARTVYSGTRAIVLEDVDVPFAGQHDSYYQALGQEFDDVMYPIVEANFGDPMAYDAATDGNGKLLMLFSKQINDFGGILGFVASCDFLDSLVAFQNGQFPVASNQAEIFYAIAPDEAGTAITPSNGTYSVAEWRRVIRATLIHEAKHIAMFAERFANPNATTFETSWLEEGMAMHSEELYARTITGATWKGNTGYGSSGAPNGIWCEVRPSTCTDRPVIMLSHFGFLYDFLSDMENRTIVGGIATGDGSFYGSSWAFIRWLLDAYAANEPAFLRAVTTEPTLTGSQNLEARIGIPFTTMVPQFHYALHYDDVPGITPTAPWQHFPSWNIRNIYAGLNTDFSTIFLADFLRDYPVGFGAFTVNVGALRGGSATHLEISGAQAAKQLVALTAQNGGAPDPLLRMTVFRIQ